jgi:hypothetical protein
MGERISYKILINEMDEDCDFVAAGIYMKMVKLLHHFV